MNIKSKKLSNGLTIAFLAIQTVLFYFILTAGGEPLRWSSYSAVILCFIFALLHYNNENKFVIFGLAFTVCADYFLVIAQPQQQLLGMVFFLAVQGVYAAYLNKQTKNQTIITARIVITVFAVAVTFAVLGKSTDALAIISLCYYANLIMNIVQSCMAFSKNRLFAIGLILFLLCDTVVGLQVMSQQYIPVGEHTFLHSLLFSGFNLSWFFYLPSQVLLAFAAKYGKKPAEH